MKNMGSIAPSPSGTHIVPLNPSYDVHCEQKSRGFCSKDSWSRAYCLSLLWTIFGAIQIICDTFMAYFRPPSPMCHLVTQTWTPRPPPLPGVTWQCSFYRKHSLLKTFVVKFSSKMDEKMTRDILVDPLPLSFGDTVANPPPPRVSRIIWMAPLYKCGSSYLISLISLTQKYGIHPIGKNYELAINYKIPNNLSKPRF